MTSPISYPQFTRLPPASASVSSFTSSSSNFGLVSPPPQASINPTLSRRRSDYIDQSQEALSGLNGTRASIDYPELSSQHILRPPPAAASSVLVERQDNRRLNQSFSPSIPSLNGPKPPRISSDYPVTYWSDIQIGTSGLKNMGNTCYMNAPIQCLSATVPFSRFFTGRENKF
jgi:ubiquitin carboxyl-terminal hydrolase 8